MCLIANTLDGFLMFEDLRNTMRFVFSRRPRALLDAENLAIRLTIVFYALLLIRLLTGFRLPFDQIIVAGLFAGVIAFYPFRTMFRSALGNALEHQAFKRDARFSFFLLALFLVLWVAYFFI